MSSAPVPAVAMATPGTAHAHCCAEHGQALIGGVNVTIWGGKGNYMVDDTGTRDFDQFRDEIDRLGKENGCHTCVRFKGSATPLNAHSGKPMNHWVCDHQPPLSIIPDATSFQLYPQCHDCSNAQWGQSVVYINSFKKHVGRFPNKDDQHLFWGSGRPHRSTANYESKTKE